MDYEGNRNLVPSSNSIIFKDKGLYIKSFPAEYVDHEWSKKHLKHLKWKSTTIKPNHMVQNIDRPSRTIQASFHRSCQGKMVLDFYNRQIRSLTWKEMAILQGFDPHFFENASLSTFEKIRLIGNVIPPKMAEVVMRHVFNVFGGNSFVEICAGTGSMGIALQKLGLKPLALIDFEPSSCRLLRSHVSNPNLVLEKDVLDIDFGQYRPSVICGGVPCQPYSTMGKKKGVEDERDLFGEMHNVISKCEPEVFVFENVEGVTKTKSFHSILQKFSEPKRGLKYKVGYRVLNSAHFGIPQTRQRVFIIGIKNGRDVESVFEAIEMECIVGKTPEHPVKTLRELLDPNEPWLFYPHDKDPFQPKK